MPFVSVESLQEYNLCKFVEVVAMASVVGSYHRFRCGLVFAGSSAHDKAGQGRNASTRRSLVILTHSTILGSVYLASAAPEPLYVADGKAKLFTNLEEAREEGERRRDQKELAEGPIISLPSGVKFREISQGSGGAISPGQVCSIYYTIYKLNGLYLDSLGYGKEGKNDVGDTLTFQYGSGLVPRAIELGMEGMQVGGKRRILVKPELGWVSPNLLPLPTSNSAERRLNNNKRQPLLFEIELLKLKSSSLDNES